MEDVHVLTGALKLFFRELKEPLIPWSCVSKLLLAANAQSKKKRISGMRELVGPKGMSKAHRDTLQVLKLFIVYIYPKQKNPSDGIISSIDYRKCNHKCFFPVLASPSGKGGLVQRQESDAVLQLSHCVRAHSDVVTATGSLKDSQSCPRPYATEHDCGSPTQ